MQYNRLGNAGIKVSELSYGSWVTFADQLDVKNAKKLITKAFDAGINFFDNAEGYADGKSEIVMGKAVKHLNRETLVISTKLFFGDARKGVNQQGLSRKHLMEGIDGSLKRLDMDYVDLLFCHRPDPNTPIEETVLAMNDIIRSGKAFYWGTSMWSAKEIETAMKIAKDYRCIAPMMEQPIYNMFARRLLEREYIPLFKKYKYGTTIWSPLSSGVLTGKYNNGIPKGSRLANLAWLRDMMTKDKKNFARQIDQVRKLTIIAQSIGCTVSQLALAWCLKNKNVSTVILGARTLPQLNENLKSSEYKDKLTPPVMKKINALLGRIS